MTLKPYKAPGKPGEVLEKNKGDIVKHAEYQLVYGKKMFMSQKLNITRSYLF